ncbi:unnamed protein product, partial [Rotaria sp. Silwood2]
MHCMIIESKFDNDLVQSTKVIEFLSNWLQLKDEKERASPDELLAKCLYRLAHIYISFEYEQNDILSMYTACRIIDNFNQDESFYEEIYKKNISTRSAMRNELFRYLFDQLWIKLDELCSNRDENKIHQWVYMYTCIYNYYPSNKLLHGSKLSEIENHIEFMRLSYSIFLNNVIAEPIQLISKLLEHQPNDNTRSMTNKKRSTYLQILPHIINCINEYFVTRNINEYDKQSTLIIDLQQWVLSIIRRSETALLDDINSVFVCLNDSICTWSLAMKQLFFNELVNLFLKQHSSNEPSIIECISKMLPIIVECIANKSLLESYQIPCHPSSLEQYKNDRPILFDLFFFHLEQHVNENVINCELINELMQLTPPKSKHDELSFLIGELCKRLREFFLTRSIALFLCGTESNNEELDGFIEDFKSFIKTFLKIDENTGQFNHRLQIFLSTIISKRSWNFLLNLLKSEYIQSVNSTWANIVYDRLELKQLPKSNKYLQYCHRLGFTLSSDIYTLSMFPKLQQCYDELSQIIDSCTNNKTETQWNSLCDWIQLKLNASFDGLQLNDIKVMLLLSIYYDYYCNNQLELVSTLLDVIERILQPLPEELCVFQSLLKPEEYMIGYSGRNDNDVDNYLNHLFRLDCQDIDELCMRHALVNLMAMIIMGGETSFLWTFAFQPLKAEKTYGKFFLVMKIDLLLGLRQFPVSKIFSMYLLFILGFGSTRSSTIERSHVHYDCGCIITESGDVLNFSSHGSSNTMSVPMAYTIYFSTFGALAWHLLLFDESVTNLHGPILSPSAINDNTPTARMVGNTLRTKVCHFVRARLFSAFNFLSIHFNQDDACILLNGCFERMAYLTVDEKVSWIKPFYIDLTDKRNAEEKYQNDVFYNVYQKLAEYKSHINQLYLNSQIQMDLQKYTTQLPIIVQMANFITEMNNPINAKLNLRVLQQFFASIDFLKMTKTIYELAQFYLLLHQTYAQFIEHEEFMVITLKELYDRAKQHLSNFTSSHRRNEAKNHMEIIDKGINAINAYHKFTNGLIRPGACDETQHFSEVSIETSVHYLVTNENPDDEDIIMRILSILVDYQNDFLDLIEQEFDARSNDNNTVLKSLVAKVMQKTISITHVAFYNTGAIALNDNDCQWIEKISCASLMVDEEYFLRLNKSLNFDFVSIQSYIIRTYLLLFRINYKHIAQKYRCFERRKMLSVITASNNEIFNLIENYSVRLENEWNHLNDMLIDKLYHGYNLLKQIALQLKDQQDDLSSTNLYDFVRSITVDEFLLQQLVDNEVKDFKLCYINNLGKLYETLIRNFDYSFIDVSDLLRIPMNIELSKKLQSIIEKNVINIDYNEKIDDLESQIQKINDLLNDLKSIEDTLSRRSTQSLKTTSIATSIENDILSLIPEEIKCENYVSLIIYLHRIRSVLKERKITIEEKTRQLWDENFDSTENIKYAIEKNRYRRRLNRSLLINDTNESRYPPGSFSDNDIDDDETTDKPCNEPDINENQSIRYKSLFQLHISTIPIRSFQSISKINDEEQQLQESSSKKKKSLLVITLPDGTSVKSMWSNDKLFQELKLLFKTKKYDFDTFVVIDNSKILLNFMDNNSHPPNPLPKEYFIIDKTTLISIQFQFETEQLEYFARSDCKLYDLINRFAQEQNLAITSSDFHYCFYNETGQFLENGTIGDIHRINTTDPIIIQVQKENNNTCLFEITLIPNQ